MKKGFTLIELLVVVLIIGILAAVALPQYTKAVEKSRAVEAQTRLGDLATAESVYYMQNDMYTKDLTALDLEFAGGTSGGSLPGDSYNITVTTVTGDKPAGVLATAKRNNGANASCELYLRIFQDGSIEKSYNNACTVDLNWGSGVASAPSAAATK